MTPGYPPHHPGLHPTQSYMSRGTPGGATCSTTPGSIGTSTDDDKGRGSYKCGRCGVPKKGHICPYQPKVKRKTDGPAPEMKCVSTQVEMDEFMTLRRLNIEIQGFPESYAAEPSDNCGTEVHPPPPQQQQPHHAAMTPSSHQQRGPPPSVAGPPGGMVKPGMAPMAHLSGPSSSRPPSGVPVMSQQQPQDPPTSLPSLSSMPSQPHQASSSAAPPPAAVASTTMKQPEQINSSGTASVKTEKATSTASEANFKAEEATKTETNTSNEKEATKVDSATNVDEEELKRENANKDVVVTPEETSADDTPKSDDANKKRSASDEEKTGDENSSESPVKKQKV